MASCATAFHLTRPKRHSRLPTCCTSGRKAHETTGGRDACGLNPACSTLRSRCQSAILRWEAGYSPCVSDLRESVRSTRHPTASTVLSYIQSQQPGRPRMQSAGPPYSSLTKTNFWRMLPGLLPTLPPAYGQIGEIHCRPHRSRFASLNHLSPTFEGGRLPYLWTSKYSGNTLNINRTAPPLDKDTNAVFCISASTIQAQLHGSRGVCRPTIGGMARPWYAIAKSSTVRTGVCRRR